VLKYRVSLRSLLGCVGDSSTVIMLYPRNYLNVAPALKVGIKKKKKKNNDLHLYRDKKVLIQSQRCRQRISPDKPCRLEDRCAIRGSGARRLVENSSLTGTLATETVRFRCPMRF
jgi:hypothetical protein